MKRLTLNSLFLSITTLSFCFLSVSADAQLYIPAGASLNLTGNALLMSGSHVINEGTINAGTGNIVLEGNLTDNGTFNGSTSTLKFSGGNQQQLSFGSSATINNVIIDKSANDVQLTNNIPSLSGTLELISGKLDIGNYDLSANNITGGSAASYVKTSGSGKLSRNVSQGASRVFPVGNNAFNGVSVSNNSGADDVFSARVTDEVLSGGLSGTAISKERVKRTWDISKTNPNSGNGVDLAFTYAASDATASLGNPVMNRFQNGYWMPQYGNYNNNAGNAFIYSGYKSELAPLSLIEYYNSSLTGKAFIQGYYQGSNTMNAALANSGIAGATLSQADSITVSLHNAENGEQVGNEIVTVLNTNGNFSAQMQGVAGPYYISIRHRNSIETWSANPVVFNDNANYDFSTSASQAFGDNQINLGGGVYAIYSGDLNQDGAVESSDYALMENGILNVLSGYVNPDITGDGIVESADYALMENNVMRVIFSAKPF